MKYPLGEYEMNRILSGTGKKLEDINVATVLKGQITANDLRISKEMLKNQGVVAEENGNQQLARNFERASELVDIPDDVILRMYNQLRPNRVTKAEAEALAQELEGKYKAKECAALVMEAVRIYEKRGILL